MQDVGLLSNVLLTIFCNGSSFRYEALEYDVKKNIQKKRFKRM